MNRNLTRYLALCAVAALTLTFLFTQQPLNASSNSGAAPPALSVQTAQDEQELDKEALHAQMRDMQTRINALREQQGREPNNAELQPEIDRLRGEFDAISNSLGGDKPVAEADNAPQKSAQKNTAQIVSPVPVGCANATATFTETSNARIPTSGTSGTITRTINVAAAGPYLWDLNLTTNITHTACADLDITITSPAGTVVTLTTDNGGSLNDLFNGTLWDDQGDVLATDAAYVNNTAAPTLVPEEAMGAFIGENPNGTWTLKIIDDAGGDFGNLASWSLEVTTLSQAPFETTLSFSNTTDFPISTVTPVSSQIAVNGLGLFTGRVRVTTNMVHGISEDIDMRLISPTGKIVTLTTDNGGIAAPTAFNGTVWSDRANLGGQIPYPNFLIIFPGNQGLATDRFYAAQGSAATLVPEEAMAAFNGDDPNGIWTLEIIDDTFDVIGIGLLDSWTLEVTSVTCCQITCPANVTQSNDPNQCGAVVNYPAPTTNGMCDTVTCMPPAGSFFALGTTTVNCTTTAGPSCSFTVTVNDTQAPTLTCPANINAVTAICAGTTQVVNYPAPTVADNCAMVGAPVCAPPSGSTFPVGATTVNCTVTDASSNTASCSFTITVFNARVQDDSSPGSVLVWNTFTGQYVFCCGGTSYTGQGTAVSKGAVHTLSHTPADRRVTAKVDCAVKRGDGSLQFTVGSLKCSITDRNIANSTNICAAVALP